MEHTNGKIGEKAYIFSILKEKTTMYSDNPFSNGNTVHTG